MRRRVRPRSLLASGFMFGLLAAAAVVATWKFGWLPIGSPEDNLAHADVADARHRHPKPNAIKSLDQDFDGVEPILITQRPLPRGADGSAAAPLRARTDDEPPQWDDPTIPEIPRRLPLDAPSPRDAARAGEIVQLSATTNADDVGAVRNAAGEVQPSSEPFHGEGVLRQVEHLLGKGDNVTAHRELSKVYWNRPELRPMIAAHIDRTARSLFFEPQPHYLDPYVVQPGDRLQTIARKYHVPWEYLAKLNRVDPRRIRPGQRLKVNHGPFAAVVDMSDFQITIHAEGYYVGSYAIGIGKDHSTPIGRFTVADKMVDPQYTDPDGRVFPPNHADNPIGRRWLAIGDGYGIHGTNSPDSIGRAESRGCIRMRNEDVAEVYDLLSVGSQVTIQR